MATVQWSDVGDAVAQSAPTLGKKVRSAQTPQDDGVKLLVSAMLYTGALTPDAMLAAVQSAGMDAKLAEFEKIVFPAQGAGPQSQSVACGAFGYICRMFGLIGTAGVVSTIVTLGFFGSFAILAFSKKLDIQIPENSDLHLLVGALIAGFTQVTSYYLGSSSGSKAKTELLANSVPKEFAKDMAPGG
jgi:hypothetical protein